ncbi:MAG: hypothetical protein IKC06_03095 [Clostridia bacterium]|nr:hypothetical protein [Clostridia bacterium]
MKLSRTTALIISILGALIGLICFSLGTAISSNVLTFVGLGLVLIAGTLNLIFNRCPFCYRFLGRRAGFSVKYCPYCGEKLDD